MAQCEPLKSIETHHHAYCITLKNIFCKEVVEKKVKTLNFKRMNINIKISNDLRDIDWDFVLDSPYNEVKLRYKDILSPQIGDYKNFQKIFINANFINFHEKFFFEKMELYNFFPGKPFYEQLFCDEFGIQIKFQNFGFLTSSINLWSTS